MTGTDHPPLTLTEAEGETLDLPEGMRPFTPGQVLGERYRVIEQLGRGGMGEVWRAFDLKLRVDVALKALRPEFFRSERRLEMLGRGGMGEVWHAFDLKLRVEVALKALREDLFKSKRRLEMLRRGARRS